MLCCVLLCVAVAVQWVLSERVRVFSFVDEALRGGGRWRRRRKAAIEDSDELSPAKLSLSRSNLQHFQHSTG